MQFICETLKVKRIVRTYMQWDDLSCLHPFDIENLFIQFIVSFLYSYIQINYLN